jgi:hypothetical protein
VQHLTPPRTPDTDTYHSDAARPELGEMIECWHARPPSWLNESLPELVGSRDGIRRRKRQWRARARCGARFQTGADSSGLARMEVGLTQRGVMGSTGVGGLAESRPIRAQPGLMRSNIRRDTTRHSCRWLMQTVTLPFTGRIEEENRQADPKKHESNGHEPRKTINRERPQNKWTNVTQPFGFCL